MKKLHPLLSVLFLIYWGCSNPEPIDDDLLIEKDGLKYHPETRQLYTGHTFSDILQKNINKYKKRPPNYRSDMDKIFQGYYKEGLRDGLWTYKYYNYSRKRVGYYRNGKKDSLWTYYFKNDKKRVEGKYSNGVKEGIWKFYYGLVPYESPNQIESELIFNNGEIVSEKCWDDKGNQIEKCDSSSLDYYLSFK